ncbi:MAG: hypothetical protein WBO97_03370 [Tepidiformaceae bacterium]
MPKTTRPQVRYSTCSIRSDEAWLKILHDAPLDDEPLTPMELQRIAEFDAVLARRVKPTMHDW